MEDDDIIVTPVESAIDRLGETALKIKAERDEFKRRIDRALAILLGNPRSISIRHAIAALEGE